MCRLGFKGLGYDEHFVEKMTEVVGILKSSPDLRVKISDSPDVLCEHCPNLISGLCKSSGSYLSEERVSKIDRMVASALEIEIGGEYRVGELNHRLKTLMTRSIFSTICGDCKWNHLGYCEEGLEELRLE